MKPLKVRFPETQHLSLSDLNDVVMCGNSSIARAAFELGMNQLKELASRSPESAKELIAITEFKVTKG